jgi:hypothetical protein
MAKQKLEPTVTIGGAEAGYKPATTLQPTATLGGAPAAYAQVPTPNYITGAGIPGVDPQSVAYRGFRAAEEASNQPFYDANPEYVSTMMKGPEGPTGTGPTQTSPTGPTQTGPSLNDLLLQQNQKVIDEAARRDRQSAYDILYNEFNKYGLGGLVEDIKYLLQSNVSPSQFSLELQNRPAYQARFAANKNRISKGLRALSPAEYIGLEDQYQNIMRTYGMPSTYYSKDDTGKQVGFEKFLANDVSASELEDRIATAQQRVLNSNPEVLQALKQFYPDINNADILAYTLDPSNALTNIKRKVTAAEIGGAALAQGLQATGGTAESLAGLGITKSMAQQGYTEIAGILPRATQLADIYGEQPYTQQTAESEVFNTANAAEAARKRKKLSSLETAAFSGSSGVGALGRDKGIYGATQGQAGLY